MKKMIVGFVFVLILGLIVVVFSRNILARFIIVDGIKKTCGLSVSIANLNIGLPSVSVSGLKIYNPSGFKDRILADIPEIYVDFDLPAFFKNQVHLGKCKVDMKELDVVLNEQGKLNVNSLSLLAPKPGAGAGAGAGKPPAIKIDELTIKIGKVAYKGSLPGLGAKSTEFDPKIDETFHNVTDPSKVAAQIMQRILMRIGIGNFANFNVTGSAQSAVENAKQEALDKATAGFKQIFSK